MPDWITHLGSTYAVTRMGIHFRPDLAPGMDMRFVLLGALLPDATRFTIILVDILDWPAIPTFTYLIPFHSLLIVAFLAGAIALVLPAAGKGNSSRAFGLIMGGAAFHFLLDEIEGQVGCGSTTFYPFYFGKPVAGWSSEGNVSTLLVVVSAILLGVALSRPGQVPGLRLRFTRGRLAIALILVTVAGLLPLFFQQRMIEANAYNLAFVTNPPAFEGQRVELCFSEVVATEPPAIEEFDRTFVLQTTTGLELGEWISVRGIYRQGKIEPVILIHHRGFLDITLSIVAAIIFIPLMFRPGGVR